MLNSIITGPQKSVSSGRCIGPSRTWILYRATLMSLHKHRKSHFQTPVTCIVSKHSWGRGSRAFHQVSNTGLGSEEPRKARRALQYSPRGYSLGEGRAAKAEKTGSIMSMSVVLPLLRLVAARRYSFPNKPEANASQGWDWENSLLEYKYLYSFKFQRSL